MCGLVHGLLHFGWVNCLTEPSTARPALALSRGADTRGSGRPLRCTRADEMRVPSKVWRTQSAHVIELLSKDLVDASQVHSLRPGQHGVGVNSGETTVTKRILYYTVAFTKWARCTTAPRRWTGLTRNRSAVSRSYSALPTCLWTPSNVAGAVPHRINIVDTPGHVGLCERSLRVLDGAVALFDSWPGVEPQSRFGAVMDKYRVPRVCFVNRMDRRGADL